MENKFYELTNPQKSIWYTEKFFENTNVNNICVSGIIYENVKIEALKKAIYYLVKENDSFRIKLSIKNGVPMQFISEFIPFEIDTLYAENKDDFKKIEEQMVNEIFTILNSDLFKFKIVIFPDNSVGIILNVHHIIADSWSLGITIQKVIQIYHCILNNEEFSQENPSYLNYVQKEIDYKKSEKYEKDKLYWNKIFDSIPDIASIPSIEGKTTISSYKANRLSFNFDKKILDKISVFCKSNNFSIFNFFMSIISVYIGRVSNLDDFVIGTPILNRATLLEKHTTGMFVNTVPVRVTLKQNYSFIDFLKYISENMFGILKHQKYSYNSILDDIRDKFSNTPNLYNIMFSYQLTKAFDSNLGNYETNWFFNNCNQNDISIHIHDINDTGDLVINYDYLMDKYSAQEIENIHKRIIHIISQIMDNNAIVLNDIEIVTPEEKKQLLYDFNNTFMPYPKDKTILDLFEEQVIKTPDNIAIVFEEQKITYKELNEKANSLAYHLRFEKNIYRNELVGIMVNRSLEMIISILAVLKSGAAYIPIDPTYPKDRVDYMLKNSNVKILLTQKNLQNKIDFENISLIDLENTDIYNISTNNLEHINQANDTSYVIFTSGSTGNPKGIMINHKNLINFVYSMQKEFCITAKDIIASITTISFDIFVLESLYPLSFGARVVIANESEQVNSNNFNILCKKNDVNMFQTTPSRIQTFLTSSGIDFIKNCHKILVGGEPFPNSLLTSLQKITSASIYNMYGPTETTVWSSFKKLDNVTNINIGKPIGNTQMYILSSNLSPLPINVPGDIYISGDGVGKGYLNNKDLTDKVFIKNPFTSNSIMYKTGDIGYFNLNGEIICLGRSDNQIKLRGLRIELGEIENAINSLPFINSCAVIKENDNLNEYLCAYFTSNTEIKEEEIISNIEKFLPKYMIPKYYMQMEYLPYTPNGKIDRKSLPKINHISNNRAIVPPRNNNDIKLIEILKNLLHIENISINDDFFDLGGDSLSAITLSSYIQKEFNTTIYVKDILNNSKIRELSDYILNNSSTYVITINPTLNKDAYEVSSAQKRILLANKASDTNSVLYNIPGGIIFDKELDLIKLEKCINTIIMRQESLRTYFELENDTVVQKVADTIDFKLDIMDNVNYENIDSVFNAFVKPFDLSIAPLFRIKYLKFTNGKNAIFIDMHHIISDGTSLSIFIDELISLYNDISLPELKITYKDYSAYEFNKLHNGDLNEAKEYWLNQFSDEIPILNMSTNFPRPSVQSFVGKKIYSIINSETFTKISDLCSSLGITPYMFLLSCYYILLSKYTSQDDIVIGSPIVGRDIVETYNLIGMFVNTLALRSKIDLSSTFKDFVLNVKENLLNAYKYQTYPFDELVRNLNLSRDASRNPLFDTMFTYQNNGYKSIEIDGIKAEYYMPDTNISKFDLSVEAVPQDDKINLTFEYSTDLFTEEFIKKMSNHYLNIVNTVLNNINLQISNISVLSENEKNRILYEFNNTYMPYPKDKTIVDLFEEQVLKTPDNIAVIFEDEKLTYKELNEKANSLAFYLRYEKNLSRNDFVGIMVNRSLEMIISILAVLKSGAAYIPIDPTYPKDRIDYMLKNSNAKILLTQDSLQYKIIFENKLLIDLDDSNVYGFNTSNLEHINQADDTSYVIFTSGSTGSPKGVVLTHKALSNLTNYCNHYVEYLKMSTNVAIVSITTISFDIFIFETLISLQRGLKLIIANENEQNSPILLNELIKKYDIRIIQSTPSRMQTFINNKNDIPFFKNLDYIILAGEQLPLNLVKELSTWCGATIYNGYGPSETTVFSTLTKMGTSQVTIGKPLDNTQIYILNNYLNVLPTGIIGEIFISGDGVGKGYLNNKELTDQVFINNPFVPNSIMYKTGDIGYFNENGEIVCLGRSDHQVKIRGLRIELGEIENVIQDYPNITKCVVVKNSANNKEFLSCYYTATKKIELNNLRQYISNYLPKYMLPSYFVALDKIPYTPNGKVDRKQLPVPQDFINIDKNKYIAPKTYLQKQLVNMFESVLNMHPIGINDNFFELGGDSLLAITLNIEIQKISQKISYQDIFNNPTILKLEEKILCTNNELMFKKVENLSENHLKILNNSKKMSKIDKYSPKHILLIGATGFLGIHILKDLIENESSVVYCLVRNSKNNSAEDRLKQKLRFYFGKDYNELFNKRIFVLQGDITKNDLGLSKEELQNVSETIDIVVNTAAIVSHFGIYEKMYNANVKSVANLIDFCKIYNKRLYHISTISVSGLNLDTSYLYYNNKYNWLKKEPKIKFDESDLYIGQNLENIYIRTKFEAEDLLLNAIANGLDAYILRMGHLMPRYTDGVFQENVLDNELINKIKTFLDIGYIPNYLLSLPLELTPVDDAAHAILRLITHPSKNNRIFHLYNPDTINVSKLLKTISSSNSEVMVLDENAFITEINKLLNNSESKNKIKDLFYDFDNKFHLNYSSPVKTLSKFTTKYLKKTGFKWHKNTTKYILKILDITRSVL